MVIRSRRNEYDAFLTCHLEDFNDTSRFSSAILISVSGGAEVIPPLTDGGLGRSRLGSVGAVLGRAFDPTTA